MRTAPNATHPVSWEAPDADVWELETAHGSSVGAVPLRQQFEQAFADGFRRSFTELGLPLSHLELRHVNGWPYVSVFLHDVPRKAGGSPPTLVLKILTRLHPGFRRRTKIARAALDERRPQRFADQWFAERQTWVDRILDVQAVDPNGMTSDELAGHLRRAADLAAEATRRHFELIAGCIPLGEFFVEVDARGLSRAQARQAVMHGTPVHAEAHQRIQRIADFLGEDTPTDLDQIRSHSSEAAAALDDYLAHHGQWATEDRLSGPLVQAFPELIVNAIRASGQRPLSSQPAADALAKLRSQVPDADRSGFDRRAADAHRSYTMLDDKSGILASWVTGVTGHGLRAAAQHLVDLARICDAAHIWALELDDIIGLLDRSSPLTPETVADRYEAWRALGELNPPPHLNGPPSPPPDPEVFPDPVAHLLSAVSAFLADKFNYTGETIGIGDHAVRGRALVATDASDAIGRIQPGDILVTTATTPAYNTILPVVAGIIVSEGGPSCHAAVVARELNLPALVGHANAPTVIPDGAAIELDPQKATVHLLT